MVQTRKGIKIRSSFLIITQAFIPVCGMTTHELMTTLPVWGYDDGGDEDDDEDEWSPDIINIESQGFH